MKTLHQVVTKLPVNRRAKISARAKALGARVKQTAERGNRTVKYTAGEIGRVRVVENFLPSAEKLTKQKSKVAAKRGRHKGNVHNDTR